MEAVHGGNRCAFADILVDDIKSKLDPDQKDPSQNIFIQEIEYMAILLTEIAQSIEEIDKASGVCSPRR
jgi:hypothetical protein